MFKIMRNEMFIIFYILRLTATMSMSKQEAVSFVSEVLKIDSPIEKMSGDRFSLLDQIIKAFYATIPFQNVSLISTKLEERIRAPSIDEIKSDVMSRKGGLCYTLNVFMKLLLESLGYEAFHCTSHISLAQNNHILTIVRNLVKPQDKYLVDVGMGFPTFEAIPVDFEIESPVYDQSFLEYKFVWEGKMLSRWHRRGDMRLLNTGEVTVDGWRRFCIIDPTPKDLQFFEKPMNLVYSDIDGTTTPFHHRLRAIFYPGLKAISFQDMSLLIENDSHILVKTKFESVSEFMEKVKEFLPLLYDNGVCAVRNLNW